MPTKHVETFHYMLYEGRGNYLLFFTIIFEIRSLALLDTSLKCFTGKE